MYIKILLNSEENFIKLKSIITNFALQYISINKGYCRLNSIVADVAGITIASSVIAVHPKVSVVRTAVLGCRQ